MKTSKKRVAVDMDGVIADYALAYLQSYIDNPYIEWPQSRKGFFEFMYPIEGGIETVKKLSEKYNVWILTRPSIWNPNSYTEKRIWIEKYFGFEMCHKLALCPDKTLFHFDYLIDDYPWGAKCVGEEELKGELIHFGTDKYPNWKSVEEYLL